jgi:monoamine oxidase
MAPRDDRPTIRFHDGSGMPDPLFYSHAVSLNQARRLIFTSGIIAQRPDGSFPDSYVEQVDAVYKNLQEVLKNSGATPRDVIKVTFYSVDWEIEEAEKLIKPFLDFITDDYGTTNRPLTTLIPVTKLALPGAKLEIEAVAAAGGEAVPHASPLARSFDRPSNPLNVDVVVVGGGFSGIQAAWDIQKAGLNCVLLEAKHRIGGRSRSEPLQSGPGTVELGATWVNKKTQPKVYETAKRLGLEFAEQYTDGIEIWQLADGTVLRADTDSVCCSCCHQGCNRVLTLLQPVAEHVGQVNMALAEAIDGDLEKFDIRRVGDFPTNLDVSMETWANSKGLTEPIGKGLVKMFTSAVVGRDPHEMGMHYFLDYIKSGGGFVSIATEGEDGAQSLKIKQGSYSPLPSALIPRLTLSSGTSAIATGLADEMKPGSILINSPVDNIHQSQEGVLVYTKTGTKIFARKVVVAIPTNTYEKIHFSPPLPHTKSMLLSSTKPGVYAKLVLTYTRAWWRDLGLQGKFNSFKGPICFSWDISDHSKQQYSLALFIAGEIATRWAQLGELQRIDSVISHLVEMVGAEHESLARDVLEVNYMNWSEEEYLGGAPTSVMPPGVLSKYGSALREPFRHIHFAGGETAYEWKGYLEGALRAGSRAAEEVIALLQHAPSTGKTASKL